MWWNPWRVVACFLLMYLCSAIESQGVVELNSTTFHAALESTAHVIVTFHAPWCPHCKAFYPTLETQAELADYWGVEYYPTIMRITASMKPSQADYYEGSLLDAKQMVDWISNTTGVKGQYLAADTSEVLEITWRFFMRNVSNSSREDGNGDEKSSSGSGPFDETYTFVQFYAPWCSHCASFAPTYDALSHAFKGQESPKVVIARMDITKEKTFSRRYEVTSLPMLRLFKGADPIDTLPYLGRRTLDDMIDYLNQKTGSDRRKDGSVGINGNTCSSE